MSDIVMNLSNEFVLQIGQIFYIGDKPSDNIAAEIVIINVPPTKKNPLPTKNGIALSFPVDKDILKIISRPTEDIDPCDRDLLDKHSSKIVDDGYIVPLVAYLEEHFGEDIAGDWKQARGFANIGGHIRRMVFLYPKDSKTVSGGEIGKHLHFERSRMNKWIKLSVSQNKEGDTDIVEDGED